MVCSEDESSSGNEDEDENDGREMTFAEAPMIEDDDKEDEDENDGGKKTFIEAPMVEYDNDNDDDDDEGMEVGSGSLEPLMRYVLISRAGAREADVEEQVTEKQETTVDHAERQKVLQDIARLEELIFKKETKKFSKALAVAREKDFRMLTALKERIDIAMAPLKKFKDENDFNASEETEFVKALKSFYQGE